MNTSDQTNRRLVVFAAAVTLCTWALPALAYLDPGTGSMLIQGIIGAIAAAGVGFKVYYHKIKLFFSGRKAEKKMAHKSTDSDSD